MASEQKSKKNSEFFEHPLLKPQMVSRREYQEKIFASSIGKNSMVVLPTSMGKTVIALLLSIYHLSNDADNKIIFLAPTKPLVVQHQHSFSNMTILGESEWQLPVMTGDMMPEKREKSYKDAKIAFMTPQVLQNDIISNKIDLSTVALIIFDEAHRAVGDYAYTFIADIYLQKNPKGQILGMSASPGGDKEKIEEVCKNLHINHVEIRSAESDDVKPYVQDVQVSWIQITVPEEYLRPKKDLEDLLKSYQKLLTQSGYLDKNNKYLISRKDLLDSSRKIDLALRNKSSDQDLTVQFNMKKVVSNAIRVSHMLELLEAHGIEPLYDYFNKCIAEVKGPEASKSLKELFTNENIRNAMHSIQKLVESKFVHPKLIKLSDLLIKQFNENLNSRVLIFANFRDTIESIINYLKQYPQIKPQKFVGQQNKKEGVTIKKGMSQKEQIVILEEFKKGIYNTLIATSVAEEGLDIAECDLVIFYDVVPSEIRTIQRRGRTGRKSSGQVYILMTKGTREEAYYYAEKKREREMKKTLNQIKDSDLNSDLEDAEEQYEQDNENTEDIDKNNTNKQKRLVNLDNFMSDSYQETTSTQGDNIKDNIKNDDLNQRSSDSDEEQFISSEEMGGKSQGFTVVVDTRETQSAVVRHLALGGIDIILKTLPIGDYIISDSVGIERKEANDFNQSIKDGRLFDELHNLRNNFEVPIMVLEGNPIGISGLSKESIMGAIASIIINMKITVFTTSSTQETAEFIIGLTKKIQQPKDGKEKIFKKKTGTIEEAQEQIIAGIPGVNIYRAQNLLTHFSTIKKIFNADESELKNVEGIGPGTAKKIKDISEHNYNEK